MRERISDAIAKRLEEGDGDRRRLYEQQALLGKSNLMTLDTFCYEVVMKHFTVSGVDSVSYTHLLCKYCYFQGLQL